MGSNTERTAYGMTFRKIFSAAKKAAAKKDYSRFGDGVYSFEFDVTGEGGGRFYIEVRDGAADIQPYDYQDARCVFTLRSDALMEILSGSVTPTALYSTGRLTLRGDSSAAFLLADSLGVRL